MERFQNLELQDLDSNPFKQFNRWFEEAKKHVPLYPEAMSVSTLDSEGYPQSRLVLFRGFKPPVFQFFTNYNSAKGTEILQHPKVGLLFYWKDLGRQIRITGDVTKSSKEDSDDYWNTRPLESQIHSSLSNQSHELKDFKKFLDEVKDLEQKNKGQKIPRPENWGGFDVIAKTFEFWQEGPFRLHHRFKYEPLNAHEWSIKRLNP